ncbi:hypothetical protein LCGC14_0176280 [marine sediment metagenome]|uniref:Uncharacterized protein n=1 Tax=marine sediment metagenome TaxID=412755 RepID=A0A0F9UVM4_9ZZZZ
MAEKERFSVSIRYVNRDESFVSSMYAFITLYQKSDPAYVKNKLVGMLAYDMIYGQGEELQAMREEGLKDPEEMNKIVTEYVTKNKFVQKAYAEWRSEY